MRPVEPFSATHPRCIFPVFGKQFDDALNTTGKSISDVANALGTGREVVRGYRRGFVRPSTATKAKLDAIFEMDFNISEPKAVKAEASPDVAALVTALNNHGFAVELRPL